MNVLLNDFEPLSGLPHNKLLNLLPNLLHNPSQYNQVMFTSLAWLPNSLPSGFIHLPLDETLAVMKAQPYMPLKVRARAVQGALEVRLGQLQGEA